MTPRPPAGRRVPDRSLVIAMLLVVAAGIGQCLLERQRSLASAGTALAAAADASAAYVQLVASTAMRRLDAVATAANGDGGAGNTVADRLIEPTRFALANVPGARFVVVFDAEGRLLASAGRQPQPDQLGQLEAQARGWFADPLAPVWHVGGAGSLLLARRLALPGGGFGGVALLALGPDWLEHFAAGLGLGDGGGVLLLDAENRLLQRAPPERGPGVAPSGQGIGLVANLPAAMTSNLLELRTVLPGQLELVTERSREDELRGWRLHSAATIAGLVLALAALAAGWLRSRQRILRLQQANRRHAQQLTQLEGVSERLSRLHDVGAIVARAEAIGQTLLACDRIEVSLREPAEAEAGAPPLREIKLLSAAGERLGHLILFRADGAALSPEDELVLEQLARGVAAALEGALLLAEARRAKSEMEDILSTISDGIFAVDRTWCVRYANAAAGRYLQHRPETMRGANLWTLLPGLRGGEVGERLEAAAERGEDAAFTSFWPPLNAWFELRVYPFAGGLTVYFRDVTMQRESEEKLRQAQKLETVGHLTGGIAHDVNNMLTVILGNLELLAIRAEDRLSGVAGGGLDEELKLDLTLAEAGLRAGESASQLMNRLLVFARHKPLSRQVVAVDALLQSLQPLIRRTISQQVSLRMHWPVDLWAALAEPAELENAILNLSINARDAMPGGGTLSIDAANVAIDRAYAAVAGIDRPGDYVIISVADTGSGMPQDILARAFDPFFTTKAPGKGTGLGLSMVYGFVRQSGGHVVIDSEPGRGTVVRMYLPRTLPAERAEKAPPPAAVAGGNETILLVEDNALVRVHTDAMLRGLGYRVVAAPDGPAAMQALAGGLRPDMLLSDVVLPGGMSGRDLADAAQAAIPALRVLFISGYAGNVLMENGRLPPGVDLLGKPFRRSELAARIRAQLGPAAGAGPG